MSPEEAFLIRADLFEEAWQKLMWWLTEDGIHPNPGPMRMKNDRFVQTARFFSRLASGRVETKLELRESPSGYWISAYRGGRRFANFRYDLTDGTFIVGMAMLSSHWE